MLGVVQVVGDFAPASPGSVETLEQRFFTVDQLYRSIISGNTCTETHQILVRKRGFPVCAEGRGRSAEASPSRKGLRKLMCVRGNPCVVFALSRKQIPKFSRKTLAEAAAEGGSKKTTSATRGRASRKG